MAPSSSAPLRIALALLAWVVGSACQPAQAGDARELEVTATAYNSVVAQTNADPTLTAWGDRLKPGMKSIAVSRDLIELGLTHGVAVEIVGLEGSYIVRDKMAKRWRHKIDIYMGEDIQAARQWGKRQVTIRWTLQ